MPGMRPGMSEMGGMQGMGRMQGMGGMQGMKQGGIKPGMEGM